MTNNQQHNQYVKNRCTDRMATGLFYMEGIVLCALFLAFLGHIVSVGGRDSLNLHFLASPPRMELV
jgi:hypothetical protein